jgi:hypothetical protein
MKPDKKWYEVSVDYIVEAENEEVAETMVKQGKYFRIKYLRVITSAQSYASKSQ